MFLDFQLNIAVPVLSGEWQVIIHERNHYIHKALDRYGSAYSFTKLSPNDSLSIGYEIRKKDVTYLNDPKTPCQSELRTEEMNTCIQRYVENEIECQLPWSNGSSTLPRCVESDQYEKFLKTYSSIAHLNEASISSVTGCLPSCRRNEFEMKIITRVEVEAEKNHFFKGLFWYPSGSYTEKLYYYTYTFSDYFADIGGYMGLLLGYSLLNFYDMFKNICMRMVKMK